QFIKQKTKPEIINPSTIPPHQSYQVLPTYSPTKHSLPSFTQTPPKQLPHKPITLNAYCPAVAKTQMSDPIDEQMLKL
ncbi:SDR family NAD(P)-dependent oxidoreductase, partial [Staphylococcus epidermidis]|uniref:SDR family NAD(P)-dependent oxidoreductase n=1 Tax=Staphylococcus epidermidis TaxID=1282 RepID=UPI0011A6002B